MFKILRYLVLAGVIVVGLSVLRGVTGAFKEDKLVNLPGLESPVGFVNDIAKGAAGVVLGIANNISGQVSETIENKATEEVTKNFNNLGEKEKEILRKAICQ